MITTLKRNELLNYVCNQVDAFFPDNNNISECMDACLDNALFRLEYCLDRVILPYNKKDINGKIHTFFNHLHSDQFSMFLYLLSNELYNKYNDINVSSKLMYLNKVMHSINCMADAKLPKVFYFYHTVGTVIGKSAVFSDYIVICHGVTIGMQNGKGAAFGEMVSLLPKCSVVGDSCCGNNSSVGIGTTIYNVNVPENHIAYTDRSGALQFKKANSCYANTVFEVF